MLDRIKIRSSIDFDHLFASAIVLHLQCVQPWSGDVLSSEHSFTCVLVPAAGHYDYVYVMYEVTESLKTKRVDIA